MKRLLTAAGSIWAGWSSTRFIVKKSALCSVMLLAVCAVVCGLSAPVLAQRSSGPPDINLGTTLVTPPLPIGPGGFRFDIPFPAGACQVVNAGPTAVLVGVRIFDLAGTEIGHHGDGTDPFFCKATQLLQPGTGCSVQTGTDFTFAYCKITVVGPKEFVRGSLTDMCGDVPFIPVCQQSHGTVAAQ